MTSKEENKKNAADFYSERSEYFMKQSMQNKLNPPRIQPMTSAKAANEVPETEEVVETKVDVDAEQTVKAVMEALVTVGDDASKHLSAEDKKFISKVCLKEDNEYMTIVYIVMILLAGYMVGSYTKKSD
tara:strand:- start:3854 stop:4240 length:387 start_codon:yes stop_codon:yes gene_type:complete